MDAAFKGFLDLEDTPYVVIDTGDIAATKEDGLSVFDSLYFLGARLNSAPSSIPAVGTLSAKIENPWKDLAGYNSKTTVATIGSYGFMVLLNNPTVDYESVYINSIGKRTYPSSKGTLCFNFNPSNVNLGDAARTIDTYSTGVIRIGITLKAGAYLGIQSNPDGSLFFFYTDPAIIPTFDKLAAGSANVFEPIGFLKPQHVYCLKSSVVAAQGIIYNAAGGVAPNCSVMAFNRANGKFVGKTKSLSDGSYLLQCIAAKGDSLFMVCLDDDGVAPDFEAQIIDRITV